MRIRREFGRDGVHLWRTFLDWSPRNIHPIPLMVESDPDVDRGEERQIKVAPSSSTHRIFTRHRLQAGGELLL